MCPVVDDDTALPRYPNRLRTEHIFPGNFIWYEDSRPQSKRNCPAYIMDIDVTDERGPTFLLLFLDTMERSAYLLMEPDTDEVTFDDSETNQQERSFMKATPREKALEYIHAHLKSEELSMQVYKDDRTRYTPDFVALRRKAIDAYKTEAVAYGLI